MILSFLMKKCHALAFNWNFGTFFFTASGEKAVELIALYFWKDWLVKQSNEITISGTKVKKRNFLIYLNQRNQSRIEVFSREKKQSKHRFEETLRFNKGLVLGKLISFYLNLKIRSSSRQATNWESTIVTLQLWASIPLTYSSKHTCNSYLLSVFWLNYRYPDYKLQTLGTLVL